MKKYYTNGELTDSDGAGVNLYTCELNEDGSYTPGRFDAAGKPYFGYLAKEITEEEFDLWKQRIAAPDMVEFFPGVFPGIGVVDKPTYEAIQERRRLAVIANRRVTRAQGLKALARKGITKSAIYDAIDSMPDGKAMDARIDFEEETTWRRSSDLVKGMGVALGLTSDQLDDLFTLASTL